MQLMRMLNLIKYLAHIMNIVFIISIIYLKILIWVDLIKRVILGVIRSSVLGPLKSYISDMHLIINLYVSRVLHEHLYNF